jgi:hypothetical protein
VPSNAPLVLRSFERAAKLGRFHLELTPTGNKLGNWRQHRSRGPLLPSDWHVDAESVAGQRVVLFDDFFSSGQSMFSYAAALRAAGARSVGRLRRVAAHGRCCVLRLARVLEKRLRTPMGASSLPDRDGHVARVRTTVRGRWASFAGRSPVTSYPGSGVERCAFVEYEHSRQRRLEARPVGIALRDVASGSKEQRSTQARATRRATPIRTKCCPRPAAPDGTARTWDRASGACGFYQSP